MILGKIISEKSHYELVPVFNSNGRLKLRRIILCEKMYLLFFFQIIVLIDTIHQNFKKIFFFIFIKKSDIALIIFFLKMNFILKVSFP